MGAQVLLAFACFFLFLLVGCNFVGCSMGKKILVCMMSKFSMSNWGSSQRRRENDERLSGLYGKRDGGCSFHLM
jgi:hypothetical protein